MAPKRGGPAAATTPILLLCLVLAAGSAPRPAAAYRLMFYPLSERTHMLVYMELAAELAARGHDVHMLSADCHADFTRSLVATRHAAVAGSGRVHIHSYPLDCKASEDGWKRIATAGLLQGIWLVLSSCAQRTDAMLKNKAFLDELRVLRDGPGGIDLLITGALGWLGLGEEAGRGREWLVLTVAGRASERPLTAFVFQQPQHKPLLRTTDPLAYGFMLHAALELPFVDFDVGTGGTFIEPNFYGGQSVPSYIPSLGTLLPTNGMNLFEKTLNVITTVATKMALNLHYYHPKMLVQSLLTKHGLKVW